ncbi:hypothetical protein IAT38_000525 [Cryptococcus sp. DSM 104549]
MTKEITQDGVGTEILYDGYSQDVNDGLIDFSAPYEYMTDDVRAYLALVHRLRTRGTCTVDEPERPLMKHEVVAGDMSTSTNSQPSRAKAAGSDWDLFGEEHYVTNVRAPFPFYIRHLSQRQLVDFTRHIYSADSHPVTSLLCFNKSRHLNEVALDVGLKVGMKDIYITPDAFMTAGIRRRLALARGEEPSDETDEDEDQDSSEGDNFGG